MPMLAPRLSGSCQNQRQAGARFALLVLSMIQLFNFADRYLPMALKEDIKHELSLTDTQSALPTTGFVLVYVVFAVLFGSLADKELGDRRILLAGGIVLWSFATAMAGMAQNLTQLIIARSLVGVGEAAFSTIVPAYIADFYPMQDRMAAYGIYYTMASVGGALGYLIGGAVSSVCNWRWAFFALGLPGMMLATTVLLLNDPVRGVNDAEARQENDEASSSLADMVTIITNKQWCCLTAGAIACSFAIGGGAEFTASFMNRYHGLSAAMAATAVGGSTLFGGITGTLLGSTLCQSYDQYLRSVQFIIPAIFMVFASLAGYISQHTGNAVICIGAGAAFITCVLVHQVPVNAASINVIHPRLRSRSVGLQVMLCHVLGDMISPPIIGMLSDKADSLRAGMQLIWMATCVASAIWFYGYKCLPMLPSEDSYRSPHAPQKRASMWTVLFLDEDSRQIIGQKAQDRLGYASTKRGV